MIRLAYLAGATALAVVYYFAFGAGPSASEYLDDLEWWRPWGSAVRWLPRVDLTARARAGLPHALARLGLCWGPPLALFLAGLALFRNSAVARTYLFFLALAMCVFVWYGYRAEQVWRFFEWRFAAVATAFAAIVSVSLFSPSLLRGLVRRSRVLAFLVIAAAAAAIFVLTTEVTGTNSEMPFNVSPWPIVTLVGFLLVGATIAAGHASGGAAVWLQKRVGGLRGFALGLALAVLVGLVGGWLIFSAPGGWVAVAFIASLYALVCMVFAARDPVGRSSGLFRFAAGALLLVAIFGSNRVAATLQRTARDRTALDVLVALEAYKRDRNTYPEKLDELVPDYFEAVPRPAIGLIRNEDDRFEYSNYGDSYALEFASVLWVQCQYSPPYAFAAADPEELAEEEAAEAEAAGEAAETWDAPPDVAARMQPTSEDLELAATLAERGLEGSWSCPEEPPKLW